MSPKNIQKREQLAADLEDDALAASIAQKKADFLTQKLMKNKSKGKAGEASVSESEGEQQVQGKEAKTQKNDEDDDGDKSPGTKEEERNSDEDSEGGHYFFQKEEIKSTKRSQQTDMFKDLFNQKEIVREANKRNNIIDKFELDKYAPLAIVEKLNISK